MESLKFSIETFFASCFLIRRSAHLRPELAYFQSERFCQLLEEALVLPREIACDIAVYIELSDYFAVVFHQHDDFASGLQGAGNIIVELAHVDYDLVVVFGNRCAANTMTNLYTSMFGGLTAVWSQFQGFVIYQYIDTDPVPGRFCLRQAFYCSGKSNPGVCFGILPIGSIGCQCS